MNKELPTSKNQLSLVVVRKLAGLMDGSHNDRHHTEAARTLRACAAEIERLRAALHTIADGIESGYCCHVETDLPHDLRACLRRISAYAKEAAPPAETKAATEDPAKPIGECKTCGMLIYRGSQHPGQEGVCTECHQQFLMGG